MWSHFDPGKKEFVLLNLYYRNIILRTLYFRPLVCRYRSRPIRECYCMNRSYYAGWWPRFHQAVFTIRKRCKRYSGTCNTHASYRLARDIDLADCGVLVSEVPLRSERNFSLHTHITLSDVIVYKFVNDFFFFRCALFRCGILVTKTYSCHCRQ